MTLLSLLLMLSSLAILPSPPPGELIGLTATKASVDLALKNTTTTRYEHHNSDHWNCMIRMKAEEESLVEFIGVGRRK